jgi:hypothetical protein
MSFLEGTPGTSGWVGTQRLFVKVVADFLFECSNFFFHKEAEKACACFVLGGSHASCGQRVQFLWENLNGRITFFFVRRREYREISRA